MKLTPLFSAPFLVICLSIAAVSAPFNTPARNWKVTYPNATCYWNETPIKCKVEYNSKEVTWRVFWKGKIGSVRYYEMRGGNWFREFYGNGNEAGIWELHPDRQILVNDEGETVKFLGLN